LDIQIVYSTIASGIFPVRINHQQFNKSLFAPILWGMDVLNITNSITNRLNFNELILFALSFFSFQEVQK